MNGKSRIASSVLVAFMLAQGPIGMLAPAIAARGQEVGVSQATADEPKFYVRLDLKMTDSEIRMVEARVIEGDLVGETVAAGPYVYEVIADGRTVGSGSFQDPLVLRGLSRSPDQQGEHSYQQTSEGTFSVRFPSSNLTPEELAELTVKIYRRGEEETATPGEVSSSPESLKGADASLLFQTLPSEVANFAGPELERRQLKEVEQPLMAPFSEKPNETATIERSPTSAGERSVAAAADGVAPTSTPLLINGAPGTKKNFVILGDGFTARQQATYNRLVDNLVMKGVFKNDMFQELASAFNIYRVNLVSNSSGVSQVRYNLNGTPDDRSDDTVISRVNRDTALGFVYSGEWSHCWMEYSSVTESRIREALNATVPDAHYRLILLNEPGGGGCAGGPTMIFTKGVSWAVVAHEMGHGVGGLGDEYTRSRPYNGVRPGSPNLDNTPNRTLIKWTDFIRPSTPLPTTLADVSDANQAVGAFQGGGTFSSGIYRPVHNCRMNGNTPEFCPVCYRHTREFLYPFQGLTFDNSYAGDFNGDGKDDLVLHSDRALALFLSDGSKLTPTYFATEALPNWSIRQRDRYFVGDFDRDGKDDLFVFNGRDWSTEYLGMLRSTGSGFVVRSRYADSIPGYDFKPQDQFFVGDFSGDRRDDLFVFNGHDWGPEYLALLRSSGRALTLVRRHEGSLPGWDMGNDDRFLVGDFDGDAKVDLYVHNSINWSTEYLGMLRSTGADVAVANRYESSLPGFDLHRRDQIFVGDFDNDGKDDIYIFNGHDWTTQYLGMLRSTGTGLGFVRRFDDAIPGWDMESEDQFVVADLNGDHQEDLYVYNALNWSTEYLGMLRSTGTSLSGSWQSDWIGNWNLGPDRLLAAKLGGSGDGLFVRNAEWFGLLRNVGSRLELSRIYQRYIHNYNYYAPLGHR